MALLKPTTNKEGKRIVRLYGKEFDVTNLTELTAFGTTYRIANPVKTKTRRSPKFIANSAERGTEPDGGAEAKQSTPESKATSAEE